MSTIAYLVLAVGTFLADQAGKKHSRRWYQGGRQKVFGRAPFAVTFRHLRNRGMALGAAADRPGMIKWISIVLIASLTPLYLFTLGQKGGGLMKAGLSLLLGGAFSNTYDRLHDGYVTDYVSFNFGPERFRRVVFNLGDFAIILGAACVAIHTCMGE